MALLEVPPEHLDEEARKLRQFVYWLLPLVALFAVFELIGGVLQGNWYLILSGIGISASFPLFAWTLPRIRQGQVTAAANVLAYGILGICLCSLHVGVAVPGPLLLAPLVAVTVALPHLRGRALSSLVVSAFGVQMVVAVLTAWMSDRTGLSSGLKVFLFLTATPAATFLILFLLIQYNSRQSQTLAKVTGATLQAQQSLALAASKEQQLQLIIDAIPALISFVDAEQRYRFVNKGYEDWFGQSHAEIQGKHLREVLGETAYQTLVPKVEAVLRKEHVSFESEVPHRFGGHRFISASYLPQVDALGNVAGYIAMVSDVTARKQHEDQERFLASASALLGSSLNVEGTLVSVMRLAIPKLADWAVVDLLKTDKSIESTVAHGDPTKEAILREWLSHMNLAPPFSAHRVILTGNAELIPDIHAGKPPPQIQEVGFKSVMRAPLVARGQILGAVSFVRSQSHKGYDPFDLAMLKELAYRTAHAVDNARLYSEAQEAVRVRDDFLSVASHELKTPLTPLKLQLQSLRRQQLAPHLVTKVNTLGRQVERLEKLIADLLDVARIANGRLKLELERVDVAELAREVAARFEEEARETKSPIHVAAPDTVVGIWDAVRLDQTLSNLISNALKFGQGKPIHVTVESGTKAARVEVRDLGIGIAPQDQARIFDRFERAVSTRHYGGFGLGLWISRQFVEEMGGSITVRSELGSGSTFRVELPMNP